MQQWLWGMFNSISAMTLVTYGVRTVRCTAPAGTFNVLSRQQFVSAMQGYPPTLWGEAIIWVIMPIILAAMFLVINGFIAAYIRLNTSRKYVSTDLPCFIGQSHV